MDWENERYTRLYTRETVDDVALSWEALALWRALLTKFDRAGVIQIGRHGWRGVAGLVRMPADVVERVAAELLEDGRVELRGDWLFAPNFMAANEARQSDRQRQADSRARRADKARATENGLLENNPVTKRDTGSQNVTQCHDSSHGVTSRHSSLAEPSLAEPLSRPPRQTGARLSKSDCLSRFDGQLGTYGAAVVGELAASRKGGISETVAVGIAEKLAQLRSENEKAYEHGVEQLVFDDGFEFGSKGGKPIRVVRFVRSCMASYNPNANGARAARASGGGKIAEQFALVRTELRRTGRYKDRKKFDDDVTEAVVKKIGWGKLCDATSVQLDRMRWTFAELYQAAAS